MLSFGSHNHWRKTVKEKNLKVMQIFFFMVGKMDVHFSRGETKEFYFISIRYHIGEKH